MSRLVDGLRANRKPARSNHPTEPCSAAMLSEQFGRQQVTLGRPRKGGLGWILGSQTCLFDAGLRPSSVPGCRLSLGDSLASPVLNQLVKAQWACILSLFSLFSFFYVASLFPLLLVGVSSSAGWWPNGLVVSL